MSARPTLSSLLRRQSAAATAAFVAALYEARGHDTSAAGRVAVVDGARYTVVSAGLLGRLRDRLDRNVGETDHVVAVDASRAAVVETAHDAPVLTPADLDDVLRYGLDRPTADALVRDWFDRSLDDIQPEASAPSTGAAPDSSRDSDSLTDAVSVASGVEAASFPRLSRALSAGVVVVLVLLLVVAAPATLGVDVLGLGPDESTTDAGSGPGAGAGSNEAGVANEPRPTSQPSSNDTSLAPGLGPNGVTDAERLADAHASLLGNRSYTWTLTYVEHVDGTESGRARERVTAESPDVYVSRVETEGFLSSRGPISYRPSYADGTTRYTPTVDGYDAEPVSASDLGRQQRRARQYYSVLLDGAETRTVGRLPHGPPLYLVEIRGSQSRTVRNYTATAQISPDGFVRSYRGSYCFYSPRDDATGGTCLSLTMQYTGINATSVDPPSWYTENGSANATPAPTERAP